MNENEQSAAELLYEQAAMKTVELANQLADEYPQTDVRDIADGTLAGAVHYWLFSRQPCENPMCPECDPVCDSGKRLAELLRLVEHFAEDSDYHQTEHDFTPGRA